MGRPRKTDEQRQAEADARAEAFAKGPRLGRISTAYLKHYAGWNPNEASQWRMRGCIVDLDPGFHDGDQTIRNCMDWSKRNRESRVTDEVKELANERIETQRAQRRLTELKLAREEGRAVLVEDLRQLWGQVVTAVRQIALAIPSRCAAELPHLTRHDISIMEREVREILATNSLANPEMGPLPEKKDD